MFFQKKKETTRYCVVVFIEQTMSNEEHSKLADKIMGEVENVDIMSESTLNEEFIDVLKQKFPNSQISTPSFVVKPMATERIKQETKIMEKKFKWKKLFNTIPIEEYLLVEDKVISDFRNAILYTENVEEVLAFLRKGKVDNLS
ncbi:hypothetical protein [Aquibacillus rhizosphaerae]|uniref:Uncharacterized protein n=1 Tax=Aquibacillus rhizosphaerae TaxID=3051431 RepID=A0ABT7L9U5_9BACI|nr:hypothetical protein [Aquibacillus sp. LR5S19]MDL4842641.1 hypothetical protein [Aquibacillus sp. LR5S19]